MKINPTGPIQPLVRIGESGAGTQTPAQGHTPRSQPAARVSLSAEAGFVNSMREAASPAPFRSDLVAEVRGQLADGTFESSVDMDRVLGSLLAEL